MNGQEPPKPEDIAVEMLEVSVETAAALQEMGIERLGEILALDPRSVDARLASELRQLLHEEYGIEWREPDA